MLSFSEMAETSKGRRREDAHLREIERQVREFLAYASQHPLHRFSAGAQKLITEVEPVIAQLDCVRRERDNA